MHERPHGTLAVGAIKRDTLDLGEDLRAARHHADHPDELVQVRLTQEAEGEDNLVPDDADVDFVTKHGFVVLVVL